MRYKSEDEVIGGLIEAYYEKRDVEGILSCVTDDIKWVGTESNDSADGKEELRILLKKDVNAFPTAFQIKVKNVKKQILSDDIIMIWIVAHQVEVPGVICGFEIRGTATCVKKKIGWLVANIHVSVPNSEMEKYSLSQELDEIRRKEQLLMESIPGGTAIYRVQKNGCVKVDYISEGIAKICGFESVQECMDLLHEDVRNGILQADWERIYPSVVKAIEEEKTIREIYHLYSKQGEKIQVSMDANVLPADDLNEEDIAVVYAVHTIISEEAKNAEIERNRYRIVLNMLGLAYWEWSVENGYYNSEKYNDYAISTMNDGDIQESDAYMKCVHPDDISIAKEYMSVQKTGEQQRSVIMRAKMVDGSYRWTKMDALMEIDENKIPTRIITVMRDVDQEWLQQKEQLEIDELTGVYNRRYVEKYLEKFIRIGKEMHKDVSIAMVDIDCFKGLNDTFGHLAGDEALKEVAGVLERNFAISKGDFVARFGGDEFIVGCQGIPQTVLGNRLNQVIHLLNEKEFEHYSGMKIGLSIGCANLSEVSYGTERELIQRADERLYRAKNTGKNKVVDK